MLNIIAYIFIAIAELIVIDTTATHLFQRSRKKPCILYPLYISYLVFAVLQVVLTYNHNLNLLFAILFSFIVTLGYSAKWYQKVSIALLAVSIGVAGEGLLWIIVRGVTGMDGANISPSLWFFSATTFTAAIIEVCLIFIICKAVDHFRHHTTSIYTSIISLVAIFLIEMLTLFINFSSTRYLPVALVLMSMTLIAIILCAGMYRDQLSIQQERLRLEFLEQQSHNQLTHYTALYENSNEVHKIRHDLKNFIIGVRALAAQKDYDGLEAQLEQFQESVQPHALVDTGNPVLDAVLTAKQTAAPNIEFQMNIVQLNCQHIDPMDVAMLAASALDNAVEGCANISSPYIEISVQRKNEMISLLVKNPTTNKPEVKRGRIVTTKPDPERHGYGILGMQRIVDKYDGNLRWSVKDGEFILSIFLQDKPMIKT